MQRKCDSYEQVAALLLNEFAAKLGLDRVEGKQSLPGKITGTDWEIDAKGVRDGGDKFVIVECRRYTQSKENQKDMAALAFQIQDMGADGGIIVTPLGLQTGAKKVATAGKILNVELDADSTASDYILQVLNERLVGASLRLDAKADLKTDAQVVRHCTTCGVAFEVRESEQQCKRCSNATG